MHLSEFSPNLLNKGQSFQGSIFRSDTDPHLLEASTKNEPKTTQQVNNQKTFEFFLVVDYNHVLNRLRTIVPA